MRTTGDSADPTNGDVGLPRTATKRAIPAAPAWQLALAQHPMYLLIREDERCAERTPPWGEPTIERYIDRLRDNLRSIEDSEQLRIGFEWSGLELELLAEEAPDVLDSMRRLSKAGRVCFYNGTYSQPHLQVLTAEANVRQLELGRAVYLSLGLEPPVTYLHQESSLHDQLPQLLRAFAYRHAALPGFTARIELTGGVMELCYVESAGLRVLDGDDFLDWEGLDGTTLPVYMGLHEREDPPWRRREATLGLLRVPPIVIDIPDLTAIDEAWLEHRPERFVLLDEALDRRLLEAPPRGRGRMWSGWSYQEGIDAEALSRADRTICSQLWRTEATQALAWLLTDAAQPSCEHAWRALARTQHHDVHCFCGPELQHAALRRLDALGSELEALEADAAALIGEQLAPATDDGEAVLAINSTPHQLATVLEVACEGTQIADPDGREVPAERLEEPPGLRFLAQLDGFGYRLYRARQGAVPAESTSVTDERIEFQNDSYRIVIDPDGVIASLQLGPDGEPLLESGNVITGTDSAGLGARQAHPPHFIDHDNARWADAPENEIRAAAERLDLPAPVRGPERAFRPDGPATVRRTPLGLSVSLAGTLGGQLAAELTISCYEQLARLDVAWKLRCDGASVGSFFDDETKLVSRWYPAFDGKIVHDIPFGVVSERSGRPFLTSSWVDWSDGGKGVALLHRGHPKHWSAARQLAMLLAWGEDTDAFGNRDGLHRWFKPFDYRLRGEHTLEMALFPHAGDWRNGVQAAATGYARNAAAHALPATDGRLPGELVVLRLDDPGVVATSVRAADDRLAVRVYEQHGRATVAPAQSRALGARALVSLRGEQLAQLAPFQVGTLTFECDDGRAESVAPSPPGAPE